MDVNKLFKTVHNLNDYISATQEVINKYSNSKIQFNMSTVLSLKKIRSLEIEYFNKCDESGAGIKILELMLRLPPSKTWSLLGKELVLLMQYWLEAIRKHLIRHSNQWWNFLSTLLKFIQEIRSKHSLLPNILVQDLSECLLDLATNCQPSVVQRFKILQCYNSACAESNREIRYALRNKLGNYFVKLSSILSSCGDIRAQYSIMETLLRWLLPRQDVAVKLEAAAKWFPQNLYNEKVRKIFIERSWQNFLKDARDFLNAHNMTSDLITTVICRGFCIGNLTLITGSDRDYYLDLNTSTEIISLMVEPSLSDVLGPSASNAVIISKDNANTVRLYRESSLVFISINVIDPQLLYPSTVLEEKDVQIVVSSRSDVVKLNRTLRRIFDTKYELLMDLEDPPPTSPARGERRPNDTTEATRFSNPIELSRRKRSGYIVRPRVPVSWKSPSTASTSSLALLREKLSALPGYKFDKEPVSVCALPQLSSVTEVTEDDGRSLDATLSTCKLRTYGVCNKKYNRKKEIWSSQSDEGGKKCATPINFDDSSISCLLVATIGSNDSVINDTLERLPKDKEVHTDNIVELLAKEALQSSDLKLDKAIVANEKTHTEVNNNIIEDTHQANTFVNEKTVISNSSNVSSADIVEGTQLLNDRQGIKKASVSSKERSMIRATENKQTTYDIQAVDDFFSQHCSQNRSSDLLISPTLAKKINETSSESSLDFDIRTPMIVDIESNQYDVDFNFDNTEIVEYLNDMVDRVCEDLDKCTEYLTKEVENINMCDKPAVERPKPSLKEIKDTKKTKNKKQKTNARLKLQYKDTKALKSRKVATENTKRMSTIVEKDSDVEKTLIKNSSPESNPQLLDEYDTPLIRRKRKLYSPKDDNVLNERTGVYISETEDYSVLTENKTVDKRPKTLATSYKDIEKIRRTSVRNTRNRRSGINLTPRTKKNNDIFDNLKKSIEGEEKIILADEKTGSRNKKLAVYNFSSDSEDEDFQKRKGSKKYSSISGSLESKSTRAQKSKARSVISKVANKSAKKNKSARRRKSKSDIKQKSLEPSNELVDERIREATTDVLNTSLVINLQHELKPTPLEPIIREQPQMEIIEDEKVSSTKMSTRRKKPTTNLSLKKETVIHEENNISNDKGPSVRSSPLPGLVIETVQVQIHKDPDDSITAAMLEKYKDIYNNDPLPDISEINTTHNLLSDLEHITYDSNLNTTEECNTTNKSNPINKRLRNEIINNIPKAKKSKLSTTNISEESEVSDAKCDKSIATLGKSPITGHGDFDESPPHTDQLKQRYEPRGLETQDLNQSMKDYFNKLTKDVYEASHSSHSEINLDKTINVKESKKSPLKLINKETTPNMSPTISITRLTPKEIGRWQPARFNSIFGSNQSSENDHPVRITRSHTRSHDKLRNNVANSITAKSSKINYRKSAISPIKMFGEVNNEKSITPEKNDYVERIRNIMTTKREVLKTVDTKSRSSKYHKQKCSTKTEKSETSSKISTNFENSNKTRQRSPVFEVTRKEKTGTIITDFGSGQGSSINEWFSRNELQKQSRAESIDPSLTDNLENVMEKLETTLTEIHHKTSKKFVCMFVDAQKHLEDLKEQRRQIYKQTALEVISDIVKVIDNKFSTLESRSQDLDQKFIEGLKEKASEVLRADCNQKRVMVSLLKEDVQAVLNHTKKAEG